MLEWFKKRVPLVLLLGAFAVVLITNFPFYTWMTGWDNLHPEFNFGLNVRRALSGVWQEHQGLGHLGGHGYAASLLHTLLLWGMSLVVPLMYLRSVFTFLMLLVGTLGVYAFVQYLLSRSDRPSAGWGGFAAGMFYLLHLGTVEQFYYQFEPFIIFYGLLPWALLSCVRYLQDPSRRRIAGFAIVSLFLSPIGFIPPLFVVYAAVLAIILASHVLALSNRVQRRLRLRRTMIVTLFTLAVNSYWLLPVTYYTFAGSDVYLASQNNQLSTQDFALKSVSYGDLSDVVLGRGFVFESLDSPVGVGEEVFYAMQPWHDHLDRVGAVGLGYAVFAVSMIGVFWALTKRRGWEIVGIGGVLLFGFVALAQRVGGVGWFVGLLQQVPLFGQTFRAAFTKVSVVYVFSLAVFFGYGAVAITRFAGRVIGSIRHSIIPVILGIMMAVYSLPTFGGGLLYDRLRVRPPDSYFRLMSYLNEYEDGSERIALFPLPWNWGWSVYEWGYSGSGFLWYGIEQPILDRAFDVWSRENETFYEQAVGALYGNDVDAFSDLLQQYDVELLLVDEHIVLPSFDKDVLHLADLEDMLKAVGAQRIFDDGGLRLYSIPLAESPVTHVSAPATVVAVSSYVPYARRDPFYRLFGDYYYVGVGGVVFPFSTLLSDRAVNVAYEGNGVILHSRVPAGTSDVLRNAELQEGDRVLFRSTVERVSSGVVVTLTPEMPVVSGNVPSFQAFFGTEATTGYVQIGDQAILFDVSSAVRQELHGYVSLRFGEDLPVAVYDDRSMQSLNVLPTLQNQVVQKCWEREPGVGVVSQENISGGVRLGAANASACLSYRIGELDAPSLIAVDLSYATDGIAKPHFCISQESGEYICVNGDVYSQFPPTQTLSTISQNVVVRDGVYWLDLVARGVSDSLQTVAYQDIVLRVGSPVAEVRVASDYWSDLGDSYEGTLLPISYDDGMISLGFVSDGIVFDSFSDLQGVNNCNVFGKGTVDLVWRLEGLAFSALDDGVACRTVILPQLSTDVGYLMRVVGQHDEGRGFKVYVRNGATGRQDLEKLLPPSDFDASFTVLPWNVVGEYTVSLENRSFPDLTTENWLRSLVFYPIPYRWLTELYLEPTMGVSRIESSFTIENVKKYGTWGYVTDGSMDGEEGMVALSQGFDRGWVGFARDGAGWTKLDHVRVNGWKNGFILNGGLAVANDELRVYLFYWPQVLEWVGFGMIVLTAGLLLRHGRPR